MAKQIATFVLGETLLGINIMVVKEVYRNMTITPIPDSPDHLRGLMNLRGRVVTVIDLNVCLGRDPVADIAHSRLLILKTNTELAGYTYSGELAYMDLGDDIVGFLIDRMDDVLTVEDDDILPAPPNLDEVEEALIDGVIKRDEQLVIVLDVGAVLGRVISAAAEAEQ